MGCDIHMYAEKLVDGKWEQLKGFVSTYFDPKSDYFSKEEFKNSEHPYEGRNYTLFSVLADVRNGSGFGGCDTGDMICPISTPKGVPQDSCKEIKKESDDWDCDGHSHSFFTVSELLQYDWGKLIKKRGYVHLEEYKEFKKNGQPESWCGGVSGGNIEVVSNEEIESIIEQGSSDSKSYYTKIEWSVMLKEYCSTFIDKTIPLLVERCADNKIDEVRIVFWFDN